jgi:hypothetical protein
MITRSEYLEWCKRRAREYLDDGETTHAIASFMSDLRKNEETADTLNDPTLNKRALDAAIAGVDACRRFIEETR